MLFELDGIPFMLGEPADLGFLRLYGRCFRIWDRGHSGDPLYPDLMERLICVPVPARLRMAEHLFSVMCRLEKRNLMAADFSEENLILNLGESRPTLCDINLYRSFSFRNTGRQPGSLRWQAPEEKKEGEMLDGRTAVYRLGMFAFDLFSPGKPRDRSAFDGSRALFEVALRTTDPARDKRYPSAENFLDAWRKAVGETRL